MNDIKKHNLIALLATTGTTTVIAITLCLFSFDLMADNFRTRLHQSINSTTNGEDIISEIRFGKQVAARILGRETLHENAELTRYVNLIGKSLVLHSSRNELDFHFAVLEKDYPNAYSTPGGYIFVTRGAIKHSQDEAELAAILAHEIAHINQKHIVNELNIKGRDRSSTSGLTRLLGAYGDTTRIALSQAVDKAIVILFDDGYKQKDELEADQVATLLLAETGYDPTALQRYLLRISKLKNTTMLENKTHPTHQNRFDNLSRLIEKESLGVLAYPNLKERFLRHTSNLQ